MIGSFRLSYHVTEYCTMTGSFRLSYHVTEYCTMIGLQNGAWLTRLIPSMQGPVVSEWIYQCYCEAKVYTRIQALSNLIPRSHPAAIENLEQG